MERLTKSRPALLLGLSLLFLIMLAVYMLGVRPLSERSAQYEQNIAQMQEETTLLQQKVIELKSNSASQGTVEQAVPSTDQSEQLLLSLQQVAQKSNARLTNISFATKNAATETTTSPDAQSLKIPGGQLQMSAQIEGGYTEIKNWLRELQKLPRLITVDSFSFDEPYKVSKATPFLTAKVVFTAYYTQ